MTRDEAAKVIGILVSADGFCEDCARKLFQRFYEQFPGFVTTMNNAWAEHYSGTWREDED
mgnify:FL=1